MLDLLVARFWIVLVWILNHVPYGPRYDLEIIEVDLES